MALADDRQEGGRATRFLDMNMEAALICKQLVTAFPKREHFPFLDSVLDEHFTDHFYSGVIWSIFDVPDHALFIHRKVGVQFRRIGFAFFIAGKGQLFVRLSAIHKQTAEFEVPCRCVEVVKIHAEFPLIIDNGTEGHCAMIGAGGNRPGASDDGTRRYGSADSAREA